MISKKQLGFLAGVALLATFGFVASSPGSPSRAGDTASTADTTTTTSQPPIISIQVKPVTIHTCPSRYATSTTVSGSVTPKQAQPVTVTLQSRSIKGVGWKTADSTETTAGFKFTEVGQCSKHGLWLRAVVTPLDGTTVQSNQSLMKVVGLVELNPIPGNQNITKLKAGSKVAIGVWVWSGDVGSKVRYETQKKGAAGWKLAQTCKRGKVTATKDVWAGYRCQFKVPKAPGIYYIRAHFSATSTTADNSTKASMMTVVWMR